MRVLHNPQSSSRPRWDGNRVTFQITDRETFVDCAISRAALLDIAQRSYLPADGWLACFLKSRDRIEAIALAKLLVRPDHAGGVLNIWSEDVDPWPPNVPVAACATAMRQSA
jgi:Protein of unknown function (DUF1488)